MESLSQIADSHAGLRKWVFCCGGGDWGVEFCGLFLAVGVRFVNLGNLNECEHR